MRRASSGRQGLPMPVGSEVQQSRGCQGWARPGQAMGDSSGVEVRIFRSQSWRGRGNAPVIHRDARVSQDNGRTWNTGELCKKRDEGILGREQSLGRLEVTQKTVMRLIGAGRFPAWRQPSGAGTPILLLDLCSLHQREKGKPWSLLETGLRERGACYGSFWGQTKHLVACIRVV